MLPRKTLASVRSASIRLLVPLRNRRRRVLIGGRAAGVGHHGDAIGLLHAEPERADEVIAGAGFHEEPGFAIPDELRDPTDARRDDWHAERERLEDRTRLVLRNERRHDEDVGLRDGGPHAVRIEPTAEDESADIARNALERREERAVADDLKDHIRREAAELTERLDEHIDPLHPLDLPDERELPNRLADAMMDAWEQPDGRCPSRIAKMRISDTIDGIPDDRAVGVREKPVADVEVEEPA